MARAIDRSELATRIVVTRVVRAFDTLVAIGVLIALATRVARAVDQVFAAHVVVAIARVTYDALGIF